VQSETKDLNQNNTKTQARSHLISNSFWVYSYVTAMKKQTHQITSFSCAVLHHLLKQPITMHN